MNLCFILGSSQELSLAELSALLSGKQITFDVVGLGDDCVELYLKKHCDEQSLMNVLGGCIKIGSLLAEIPLQTCSPQTLAALLRQPPGIRLTYGLSASSVSDVPKNKRMDASRIKQLGLGIKRELKSLGIASRCVLSQDSSPSLSSVVVEKNKLLKTGGIELLLIQNTATVRVYATKAVQPFELFSQRDFGRPSRSMSIGMLPPKVARMMVNISGAPTLSRASLLDPFCGTGTVLQEAALLGVETVVGTDNGAASLASATKNMLWLKKSIPSIAKRTIDIRRCDARELNTLFHSSTFDCITTETYLGPVIKRGGMTNQKELLSLEQLYVASFKSFKNILRQKALVVIAFPFWPARNGDVFLPTTLESLSGLGFANITRSFLSPFKLPSAKRNSILWYRANQQVGREICVFKFTQNEIHTHLHRA